MKSIVAAFLLHSVYMGRMLIVSGLVLVVAGLLVILGDRLPVRLGHLPGDIEYRGKNSVVYFPWVSCLVVSAILSALLWFFNRR